MGELKRVFPPTAATLGKEFLDISFFPNFLHFCVVFPKQNSENASQKG